MTDRQITDKATGRFKKLYIYISQIKPGSGIKTELGIKAENHLEQQDCPHPSVLLDVK
jgi:hypothetical protein